MKYINLINLLVSKKNFSKDRCNIFLLQNLTITCFWFVFPWISRNAGSLKEFLIKCTVIVKLLLSDTDDLILHLRSRTQSQSPSLSMYENI